MWIVLTAYRISPYLPLFKKKNVFLAAQGLHCCSRLSLAVESGGSSLVVVCGFLTEVASLLQSMGSRAPGLTSCGTQLVTPWHVGSSRTRDQTCVLCIGRRVLNHWTTREVQYTVF